LPFFILWLPRITIIITIRIIAVEIVILSSKIRYMTAKSFRRIFVLFLALGCFWFSCAGKPPVAVNTPPVPEAEELPEPRPEAEETGGVTEDFLFPSKPGDLIFIPAGLPALVPAPGVGIISPEARLGGASLSGEERDRLQDSFRAAYVDGLLKELPLTGVLGGDQVHGWPDTNPSGWVQNWRSARPVSNSWGIPSLILAIRGVEISQDMAQDRVFIVDGEILNYYGISAGLNGANGDMGYGSPRGEKFFYDNGIAQRFDLGLIVIDDQGKGSFLPGEPPSAGPEPPPDLGIFRDAPRDGKIRDAFLTAWKMALDRNIEMVPDGPGQYLSGSSRDSVSSGAGKLRGLYIQTFNRFGALLILPEASGVPPHARFLGSPFLELFLSPEGHSLPGTEGLEPEEAGLGGGDDFARRLMRGISLYGFPLTDPMPYRADGDSPWQETQRFSRGWLRAGSREPQPPG
jgi:hypothetical protein